MHSKVLTCKCTGYAVDAGDGPSITMHKRGAMLAPQPRPKKLKSFGRIWTAMPGVHSHPAGERPAVALQASDTMPAIQR
eukprot:scaffold669679_cov59-Prasinocladus_malaysianus.AAC.1